MTQRIGSQPGEQQKRDQSSEHHEYREQTPQEAHDHMKEVVSKAIGTAAGAVEGFAETMKKNDVPERAKEAIEKLGETSRKIGIAGKEQFQKLKEDVAQGDQGQSGSQGQGQTGSQSGRQIGSQSQSQIGSQSAGKTRSAGSPFESNPQTRSTGAGQSEANPPSMHPGTAGRTPEPSPKRAPAQMSREGVNERENRLGGESQRDRPVLGSEGAAAGRAADTERREKRERSGRTTSDW